MAVAVEGVPWVENLSRRSRSLAVILTLRKRSELVPTRPAIHPRAI